MFTLPTTHHLLLSNKMEELWIIYSVTAHQCTAYYNIDRDILQDSVAWGMHINSTTSDYSHLYIASPCDVVYNASH